MADLGTAPEIKVCPRCGRVFECRRNDPAHCDCARVELCAATRSAINGRYRDCLCLPCLTALAAGADLAGDAPKAQA
ncbi:cysteine-rich CWC family protein [uncultured Thiodictyon sp.]|uniref:cysteine-rich CWC family protein n=1 Tax=uncultured Thiodictyon sp. TaxID=1846217 RepID=UPI0025EC0C7E|nr:cysteine-rich CWC family protein [uncultured Thiodictyon sp.]